MTPGDERVIADVSRSGIREKTDYQQASYLHYVKPQQRLIPIRPGWASNKLIHSRGQLQDKNMVRAGTRRQQTSVSESAVSPRKSLDQVLSDERYCISNKFSFQANLPGIMKLLRGCVSNSFHFYLFVYLFSYLIIII